ncbi:hypothetical protein TREES_T100000086 [Tupaia chinensis]|uniref:Uncharacterized protein n=1 Tax=Tupaia chinensis TaxID=246437 RepID=L9L9J4_TUPCH|nr:hypothetical protein TREES_T100000086 [Tupaia chinensis]
MRLERLQKGYFNHINKIQGKNYVRVDDVCLSVEHWSGIGVSGQFMKMYFHPSTHTHVPNNTGSDMQTMNTHTQGKKEEEKKRKKKKRGEKKKKKKKKNEKKKNEKEEEEKKKQI